MDKKTMKTEEEIDEYYFLKPIEPKNKPMSLQTRLWAYSVALTLWLLSGIFFGFGEIKWWGIGFAILIVGYEFINYFVIKKRLK